MECQVEDVISAKSYGLIQGEKILGECKNSKGGADLHRRMSHQKKSSGGC